MSGALPVTRYCGRCLTTFPGDVERCPNLACRAGKPTVGWAVLMEAGNLIDRTYRVQRRLAIGGAGVTYLGREIDAAGRETGPHLAIKVLYQQRDAGPYLRRLATEAQILQGLNHQHIVECRGFVHRAGHSPYLVTKFEEGGSLLDQVRREGTLPVNVVAQIGRQVCWALDVAHRQGVIHRDLKPENVLLEKPVPRDEVPVVRVADFGIAKVFGGVGDRLTRVGAFVGTPQYAAPEQFEGLAPQPETDVYAVGALLYFCLTARPIADFIAEIEPEEQRDHLLRHLPPRLPKLPEDQRAFMEGILARAMAVDPGDRPAVATLEGLLAGAPVDAHGTLSIPGEIYAAPSGTLTLPPQAVAPLSEDTLSEKPDVSRTDRVPAKVPSPLDASRTLERSGPSGTVAGLGCGVLGTGLLGVSLVVGGVLAWLFWFSAAPEIGPSDPDPRVREDWSLVAGTLGVQGVAAERACGAPPYLALRITVRGNGKLSKLELLNYSHEPTRACMERQLLPVTWPRAGRGDVAVSVALQQ
jgi:serine/threonine protein kinase